MILFHYVTFSFYLHIHIEGERQKGIWFSSLFFLAAFLFLDWSYWAYWQRTGRWSASSTVSRVEGGATPEYCTGNWVQGATPEYRAATVSAGAHVQNRNKAWTAESCLCAFCQHCLMRHYYKVKIRRPIGKKSFANLFWWDNHSWYKSLPPNESTLKMSRNFFLWGVGIGLQWYQLSSISLQTWRSNVGNAKKKLYFSYN